MAIKKRPQASISGQKTGLLAKDCVPEKTSSLSVIRREKAGPGTIYEDHQAHHLCGAAALAVSED
jgi:hypothetical protein